MGLSFNSEINTVTYFYRLVVYVTLCNLLLNSEKHVQSLIIRENPVRLRVLEYSSRNGGLQKVLNSRYSDLVVGEEVEEDSQLVLECSSLFGPLRWIYTGDGQPQHKSYYSSTSRASTGMSYTAYLSFPNGLGPKDTGQYSCQNSYNVSVSNYVYLYVPKTKIDGKRVIFVPNRRKHEIPISPGEKSARIPCAVTHPNVNVSLERVSPRKLFWLDAPERIPYNPKTGFIVDVSPTSKETYTCRGEFKGQFEEVDYVTSPHQPRLDPDSVGFRAGYTRPSFNSPSYGSRRNNVTTLPPPVSPISRTTTTTKAPSRLPAPEKLLVSACTPQYCGSNAECIVKDFKPYCICLEEYTGDAKTGCRKMSDHSQHLRVEDPCSRQATICGKNSDCININGHPLCTCLEGYYGSPPKCSPHKTTNCSKNYDCDWEQFCNTDSRKCEDICEGQNVKFCGKNALCTAFSHMPYCTCPPGGNYIGDPYDTEGPGCHIQSEKVQEGKVSCNPSPCGVNAHCKVYSSYPLPICFCPQAFTGDPSHRCYKVSPAPIVDVFQPHYNTHRPLTTPRTTTPSYSSQEFLENPNKLCTPEYCGENARCRFRNNAPECHCNNGYKGDAYKACFRKTLSPSTLRQACSVCGPNSVCSMISSDVRCSCSPDSVGSPPNCKRSSSSLLSPAISRLPSPSSASSEKHQVSVVSMSTSSAHEQHQHSQFHLSTFPTPLNKHSSSSSRYRNACRSDLDCPEDQVCYTTKQKCVNPCSWACSDSAVCSVSNHRIECRCPVGFTGNSRLQCTKIKDQPAHILPKPENNQQQTVHEHHPCRFLCGANTVCRRVAAAEMSQLRRKALTRQTIARERDPFQRALLQQIKRVSGNKNNLNYDIDGERGTAGHDVSLRRSNIYQDGYFTECKCMSGAFGNAYSIEGCSFENENSNSAPLPIYSPPNNSPSHNDNDLDESPSSSSTIVIQVDPCHPHSPCGPNSLCVPYRGQAFCRCHFDSIGLPPNCMLLCGKEQHCLFDQICVNQKCVPKSSSSSFPSKEISSYQFDQDDNQIRKK